MSGGGVQRRMKRSSFRIDVEDTLKCAKAGEIPMSEEILTEALNVKR